MKRVKNVIIDRVSDPEFSCVRALYPKNVKIGTTGTCSNGNIYGDYALLFETEEEAIEAEKTIVKLYS